MPCLLADRATAALLTVPLPKSYRQQGRSPEVRASRKLVAEELGLHEETLDLMSAAAFDAAHEVAKAMRWKREAERRPREVVEVTTKRLINLE